MGAKGTLLCSFSCLFPLGYSTLFHIQKKKRKRKVLIQVDVALIVNNHVSICIYETFPKKSDYP